MLRNLKGVRQYYSFNQRVSKVLFSTIHSKNGVTVETSDLAEVMNIQGDIQERLVILNATGPKEIGYIPRQDHIQERIKGSIFLDFASFSDPKQPNLSFMLPDDEYYIKLMKDLDIRKSDLIVVYDKNKMINAPRAYWMLKTFGSPEVYILNGSFSKWAKENREIESGENLSAFKKQHKNPAKDADFEYTKNKQMVKLYTEVQDIIKHNQQKGEDQRSPQFIDARPSTAFSAGNIPTSKNSPFSLILDENQCFKSPEQIIKVFKNIGISDPQSDQIINYCQKGMTSCVNDVAFKIIGNNNTAVYDGSFEEYSKK